jgi:NAD(P)-dependent dehydrogenase (short-subunit alcohol dehydrogenase family)
VALVTGAARGQGLAIARRLRSDGFEVVACDLDAKGLADASDTGAFVVAMDVANEADWRRAIGAAVERYGQLDVLVNNAGILRRVAIGDESSDQFRNTWEVNCLGPFLGIQAALPYLLQSTSAAIVNTCSTSALKGFPLHSSYCASKWALRGLTQALAAELGPRGIRVNALMPGPIETKMLSPEAVRRLRETGRELGQPEDAAALVSFLVSAEARFVSGAEFVVDGGQMVSS